MEVKEDGDQLFGEGGRAALAQPRHQSQPRAVTNGGIPSRVSPPPKKYFARVSPENKMRARGSIRHNVREGGGGMRRGEKNRLG